MNKQNTDIQNNLEIDINASNSPFFSIVIATYNRVRLLHRALESLVVQTEKDWEAIIVDDGSTDNTYTNILPYLEKHPNIKYFRYPHSGGAITKNRGIMNSKGKYVTFLDSDDEYDPDHLRSRKAILKQKPGIDFLYGGAKIIGNKYVPDRFDHSKKIHIENCVIGGTFFIKKDVLVLLKGFKNLAVGTDSHLFEIASEANILIHETNLPTYIYNHDTKDSITNRLLSAE